MQAAESCASIYAFGGIALHEIPALPFNSPSEFAVPIAIAAALYLGRLILDTITPGEIRARHAKKELKTQLFTVSERI